MHSWRFWPAEGIIAMEKMDVIKFIKAQIDTEMAKLNDAKDDDMYAQGKILA